MPRERLPPVSWTTPSALAAYLGISRETVVEWCKRGMLTAHQIQRRHYSDERPRLTDRGRWLIYRDDVESFLRDLRGGRVTRLPASLWRA